MPTHFAAVAVSKGQPFEVQSRPTPKPGPGELLIAVKSIALNPADGLMRNLGILIPTYPAVVGFDMAGLVLELGEDVPTGPTKGGKGLFFQPGITRVAAYSAFFWKPGKCDYGAFQERCLVPWQHAVPLPNDDLSWNHAATLPVAAQVPLSAWDTMDIPRIGTGPALPSDTGKRCNEALLIWGASSSVGTFGVQSARLLKQDKTSSIAAVYATASQVNHGYIRSLGADHVFDYKDPQVVEAIVSAARKDGLVIRHCFLATGQLTLCQAVLKAFLGDKETSTKESAKIASAPVIPVDADGVDGVKIKHIQPSLTDEESLEQFKYWMGTWLRENLAEGTVRPSPEPTVVGTGLEAINAAIDKLSSGVSCTKLIVEIGKSS